MPLHTPVAGYHGQNLVHLAHTARSHVDNKLSDQASNPVLAFD